MHELFEELEAWNPRWQLVAPRIPDAAQCAGPHAVAAYQRWLQTDDGKTYDRLMSEVPNYSQAIREAQEAAERLPVAVATMKDA